MKEDDMVMRVGNSLKRERDEPIRREGGLQARGAYKDVRITRSWGHSGAVLRV
jgi:hypothetical protein